MILNLALHVALFSHTQECVPAVVTLLKVYKKPCIFALFFDFVVLMNSTLSGDAINTEGDRDRNIYIVTYQVILYLYMMFLIKVDQWILFTQTCNM